MSCPECIRLAAERELQEEAYQSALEKLASAENADPYQYMRLRARAQEAKIDRDLAETEFEQHQDRHAVLN